MAKDLASARMVSSPQVQAFFPSYGVTMETDGPRLTAYRVSTWPAMRLVPAARARQWMDATRDRFANRCLPLLMANQAGWFALNHYPFRATWTGGWDQRC